VFNDSLYDHLLSGLVIGLEMFNCALVSGDFDAINPIDPIDILHVLHVRGSSIVIVGCLLECTGSTTSSSRSKVHLGDLRLELAGRGSAHDLIGLLES
jgi:hypothetical protein